MSNKIQIRRGVAAGRPTFDSGEPGLDTDAVRAWIGTTEGNRELQMKGSTTDYTIYVATSALGGIPSSSGATGKAIRTATATSTTANKLVDSTASFASATHLNKPVYNSTDDTWAKITAVDSTTQCSLSADIMVSGEGYIITNAFDNIPEAFNVADAGYNANITIRASNGAFSNVLTLIGKTAGAAKTLTLQGSTTGTTTVSGETSIYQKINLKNITFTKRIFEYFGADVDWTTCVTSGDDGFLLLKSTSVANVFRTSSVIVIENDPAVFTSISSTVTKGYTLYVATSTYGGSDAVGDGLKITQGSATATTANKLVDSTTNFNSTDHLNKTLYNSTDDTWAQITAIDSTTQVSISADIMASGETYVIANAVATVQKAIDLVPGTVNCNTTVKVSTGIYTAGTTLQGKGYAGNYTLTILATLPTPDVTGTATSGAGWSLGGAGVGVVQPVLNDTAKSWTASSLVRGPSLRDYFCLSAHTSTAADQPEVGANWRQYWSYAGSSSTGAVWASGVAYVAGQHANKLLRITGGTGVGQELVIDWNKSTQLMVAGIWATTPDNTSTYAIYSLELGSKIDLNGVSDTSGGFSVKNKQSGVIFKYFYIEDWHQTGYGIYATGGSELSIYSCKLFRDRTGTPAAGFGAIHIEGGSTVSHLESTIIVEAVATTCINSAIVFSSSLAPILGDNIRNIKVERCGNGFNCFGGAVIAKASGGTGSGWVLRNARSYAIQSANVGNVDIPQSILTCCGINGVVCLLYGTIVLRPNTEISMCGGDGIQLDALSSLLRSGVSQLNYNGGWGVNTINLSMGYGTSGLTFTGNTSGTYTADASSKNT